MRQLGLITIPAAILSFGLTLGAAPQPAEAGKACNRLNLSSPCIRSGDMKPTINLGKPGNDGDFAVKDAGGIKAVKLDGDTGNVTNSLAGNGLVKAWARINANGSIAACWRCNTDPLETGNVNTGTYEVDFTPLGTDIRARPRSAVLDSHVATAFIPADSIRLNDSGDTSSVVVRTSSQNLGSVNSPFTLFIY